MRRKTRHLGFDVAALWRSRLGAWRASARRQHLPYRPLGLHRQRLQKMLRRLDAAEWLAEHSRDDPGRTI